MIAQRDGVFANMNSVKMNISRASFSGSALGPGLVRLSQRGFGGGILVQGFLHDVQRRQVIFILSFLMQFGRGSPFQLMNRSLALLPGRVDVYNIFRQEREVFPRKALIMMRRRRIDDGNHLWRNGNETRRKDINVCGRCGRNWWSSLHNGGFILQIHKERMLGCLSGGCGDHDIVANRSKMLGEGSVKLGCLKEAAVVAFSEFGFLIPKMVRSPEQEHFVMIKRIRL